MNPQDDIITAIITPRGESGISVIRVCGKGTLAFVDKRFRGKTSLALAPTHTAHFGHFVGLSNDIIDEVITTVFRSPHSYTTDDTVEISCHGGFYISQKIIEILLASGARAAEPGEFTKRAFLNGRIDLSQAEAVADLIHSRSESAHKISIAQLEGRLSNKIIDIRNKIMDISSLLEIELDFSEEGLGSVDKSKITQYIKIIHNLLSIMVDSYRQGKMLREGVRVTLAGKPNVGKSSIFNSLLSYNRAIVSTQPGTTRDFIEESISINGVLFDITDTAGIRDGGDQVEIEGILRGDKKIKDSDIVLFILNANEKVTNEDNQVFYKLTQFEDVRDRIILVLNKTDLCKKIPKVHLGKHVLNQVAVSAKTGSGISELRRILHETAIKGTTLSSENSVIITNERHKASLENSLTYVSIALKDLKDEKSNEFIASSLRISTEFLSEIIGKVTSEEVLNNIFSKFCIGK
jgi:tRNA modification GTPase